MRKAYDTILESEVTAELVAQTAELVAQDSTPEQYGLEEPYRFECCCCGEEVYIAAKFSKKKVHILNTAMEITMLNVTII